MQSYQLSENFIEKNIDKLDLDYICIYQKLSEKFIEKHFDELDRLIINNICVDQRLSEEFIEKHINKLYLYDICERQNVSKKFAKKHKLNMKRYDEIHKKISYNQKIKEVKNSPIRRSLTMESCEERNRDNNCTDFIKRKWWECLWANTNG
ncbi:hypothetical protein LCGC14_2204800 [marine sediment metagenome]|uniref:Uncharacterized protein n=1 Tax=marine sediment metagenome TaxID=412755 RepID=A0A0F9FSZ8_9ZZZZ